MEKKLTAEYCPRCETEVVLKDEFVIQECPNCHKPIMPCSICEHGYVPELNNRCHSCSTCPLETRDICCYRAVNRFGE